MAVDIFISGIGRGGSKTGFQSGVAQAIRVSIFGFQRTAQTMALGIIHCGNQIPGHLKKLSLNRTIEDFGRECNDNAAGTAPALKNMIGNSFEPGAVQNIAFGFDGFFVLSTATTTAITMTARKKRMMGPISNTSLVLNYPKMG